MSCRQRRGKRSSLGIYSDGHERSWTSCPCVLTVSLRMCPKPFSCPAPCVPQGGDRGCAVHSHLEKPEAI